MKQLYFLFFIFLFLESCSHYREISVVQQGRILLPDSIKNISVISCIKREQSPDCIKGFYKTITEITHYNVTEDFSYKGFDDFPSNIKQLEYFHPDILVVLEDLNFTMDTSQFRWAGAPTNPRYRSSQYRKRVIVTSSWKTYDVRNEKTINECTFRDTVIYYLYGNINKGSNLDVRYPYHKYGYTSYLTNDMNENDLKSIASYEGIEYARWIAPHLAKTKRFFYSSGNKNLRKAFKEMKKNNWNDAEEIW